jgi:hypothetical protein
MGAGIGVGIGVGLLITPPGLVAVAVVATTLAGAGVGKLIDKIYQSNKNSSRKSTVLGKLNYFALDGMAGDDLNNGKLAEQFLKVFIRDTQVKFPVELAKVARKSPTNHHTGFDKGTREADLNSSRGKLLSKFDFTTPGKYYYQPCVHIHPAFGSSMPPEEAVRHRWRRIELYNSWIQKYTKNLSDDIERELVNAKNHEKTIMGWVETMIGFNDHTACPDDCCFGPTINDVIEVPPDITTADFLGSMLDEELKVLARSAISTQDVVQIHDEEGKEDCEDAAEAAAFIKDIALNAAGAILGPMGAKTGNAVLTTSGAAVGGTVLPVVGELAGLAMNEAMKSYTTNYPLQKRVGCLRELANNQSVDYDEEIKKAARAGSTDMLVRSLCKVHSQYIKRIVACQSKLSEFLGKINGRKIPVVLHSCEEAVTLLRYYFKLVRYYEKALIHIQLVSKGVELITEEIQKSAKRGY